MSTNAYADGKFDARVQRGYDNDYRLGSLSWWHYLQGFLCHSGFDLPAACVVETLRQNPTFIQYINQQRQLQREPDKQ